MEEVDIKSKIQMTKSKQILPETEKEKKLFNILKNEPLDTENDFKPEYVFIAKKKEAVQRIKEDALKAERVYLATDPDREGEAIAWHIVELLKGIKGKKGTKPACRQGRGIKSF